MNKIIILILLVVIIVFGFLLLTRERDVVEDVYIFDLERIKEVAEQWIKSEASTYVFDGHNLEFLNIKEIKRGEKYGLMFSFESRAAGYGDRTDEMAAQVITPHIIEVVVENGEVISAVTDGVYDEISKEMISENLPETMRIELYFVEIEKEQEKVVAVERSIPYTVAPARAALEALLAGLLSHEEAEGLSTAIPEGAELLSIDIQNGVATADFNEKLQEGVAGSARVMAIRNQIEKTLLQFNTVDKVVISIDGRVDDILQP